MLATQWTTVPTSDVTLNMYCTCDFPADLAGVDVASGDLGCVLLPPPDVCRPLPLSPGFETDVGCICCVFDSGCPCPWSNELDGEPPRGELGRLDEDFPVNCTHVACGHNQTMNTFSMCMLGLIHILYFYLPRYGTIYLLCVPQ